MPWTNDNIGKLFQKLNQIVELLEPKPVTMPVKVEFKQRAGDKVLMAQKKRGRPKGSKNAKRTKHNQR